MPYMRATSRRRDRFGPDDRSDARLVAVATAQPRHRLAQADVRAWASRVFAGRGVDFERLLPAYDNAGIDTRASCVPLEWYGRHAGWKERMALFREHAVPLLAEAAQRCLDAAGLAPDAIDALVVASTTGIATPSLDALLMERMPFRRDVERLPIFGLGCAGGVLGLARAAGLARGRTGSRVLFLTVELCGIAFRPGDTAKSNVIATALFGDGAAAALVSTHPGDGGPAVVGWGEHTWPDSLDVMGWRIEDDGLGVLFSRDIPHLVRTDLGPVLDLFLAGHGLARADLAATACHPGGAKVLDALEEVFGLDPGGMVEARGVLRRCGNMSAPTALFVLDEVLRGPARGPVLTTALGPGFSAGFVLLDV